MRYLESDYSLSVVIGVWLLGMMQNDSETGKGDTILNREQKYENLRRADWYMPTVWKQLFPCHRRSEQLHPGGTSPVQSGVQ